MLRSIAAAFAVICIAGSTASAQAAPDPRSDEAAIRATIAKALKAHHTGDPDLWLQTVTNDVVAMLPGDTAIRGIRNVETMIRQFFATTVSALQARVVDVQISGDVAIVRTEDGGTFTPKAGGPPTPVNMKELLVFRRQPDRSWKAAHIAVVPNAGPPVVQAGAPAAERAVVYASAATAKYEPVPQTTITLARLFGDANADAPHGEFITFPPNFDAGGWHVHANDVNLVVLKGAYLYRDDTGEKRVGVGEFIRIPGGHRHWSGSEAREGAVFYMHQVARMDQTPAPR